LRLFWKKILLLLRLLKTRVLALALYINSSKEVSQYFKKSGDSKKKLAEVKARENRNKYIACKFTGLKNS
jgi:hypothetical protein